jgi:S-adenosylmethionine:tRNA ribosyltransferase-isomerase
MGTPTSSAISLPVSVKEQGSSPSDDATILDFDLPSSLEAGEPPEARGLARDDVRLMVSHYRDDRVQHTRFRELPDVLEAGDVLVINTSGTMNAALSATRLDGTPLELHLSTHLPADLWIVELRQPEGGERSAAERSRPSAGGAATRPLSNATPGETLALPGGAAITLHVPYRHDHRGTPDLNTVSRLWIATLRLPCGCAAAPPAPSEGRVEQCPQGTMGPLQDYLARYGFPIRYSYVKEAWPISSYQTVYATEIGSAEMPSAGRAFTPELLTRLIARGVLVVPLLLHTGVSSLEDHEPPYEEFYRVPLETARVVNAARIAGGRIVAVGTTVVRALETVTDREGTVHPGEGWTRLVVTAQRGVRAIDALLTGLHEPRSSHLAMLAALAGRKHLAITYAEALRAGYLWHEFGDLHLIVP